MDEALAVDASAPPEPDYPRHWEADVVASDGGVVHLRPILPGDADAIVAFHARLSERTRYLRYFGPYPYISPRDLERFTVVDHNARVALVALLGDEIIAIGRYEGTYGPDGTEIVGPAEVAFVVRDDHQSRGLGSILLEHLTAAGRERGVRRFEAEVLAENSQMVRVFRDAGYQVSREFADGVLHLEFDIDPTERSMEVRDAREQRAEARSVHNAAAPALGRRHRRVDRPRQDRPRGAPPPPARQLRRAGLSGQPGGPVGARGARLPGGHRHPGRRRPRRGRGAGGRDGRRHGLLPGQGGQGARRASAPGSPTPGRTG